MKLCLSISLTRVNVL